MKSMRDTIFKGAAILMAMNFIAHVTAFVKQMMVASWFGTSETMDAYLIAAAVIGLIQLLVSRPIRQCLIPMFRHDLAQHGEKTAWFNVSILFNNTAVILLLLVLVAWWLAPYLVALIAPGFDPENRSLASSLAQITVGSVVFVGMGSILSQLLLSYRKFLLPGSVDTVNSIVVILVFLALGSTYGIYGLAVGVVIGSMTQFVLQLPILWQKRKLYRAKIDLSHPGMKEMGQLALPALFSTSGKQLSRITDRIFASMLPAGSLSALGFASGLMAVMKEFLIEAPDQAIFPHLTKLSAEKKFAAVSRQLFNYVRIVFFITLPIGIGAMVLAEPIISLVFQRGAFDETSVRITSQALMFYAIGLPAAAITAILSRTFFGLKDTWTPTKVAFIRHGTRIALSWLLIGWLGHRGIALADSVSLILSTLCLFLYLPEEIKGQEGWATLRSFGQTVAASVLMLVVVYAVKARVIEFASASVGLLSLVFLGIAIYAAITLLMRRKDMQVLFDGLAALLPASLARKC
jgi:putative peptidoglycan lipid II flippase